MLSCSRLLLRNISPHFLLPFSFKLIYLYLLCSVIFISHVHSSLRNLLLENKFLLLSLAYRLINSSIGQLLRITCVRFKKQNLKIVFTSDGGRVGDWGRVYMLRIYIYRGEWNETVGDS